MGARILGISDMTVSLGLLGPFLRFVAALVEEKSMIRRP